MLCHARGGSGEDKVHTGPNSIGVAFGDGLMLQHIEVERGTLSRIARTMKYTTS